MPVPKKPFDRLVFLLVFSIILCGACEAFRPRPSEGERSLPGLESVVVIGFQTAVPDAQASAETVNKMTAKLFEEVQKKGGYELISPGKARGVYSSLISSDAERTEFEMFQKIGQAFSADAVLVGNLYRWRERVGSEHGVDMPASVAFDLSLIWAEDGAILWREKFDKTQRSLSENLLDWNTFVRGRGRWMTAQELAALGLEDMLSRMPTGEYEENE